MSLNVSEQNSINVCHLVYQIFIRVDIIASILDEMIWYDILMERVVSCSDRFSVLSRHLMPFKLPRLGQVTKVQVACVASVADDCLSNLEVGNQTNPKNSLARARHTLCCDKTAGEDTRLILLATW